METNQKKILIIDDEERVCNLLKDIFEDDKEIQVLTALSALQGLSLVEKERPDKVLLDIRMPQMDGIEVLKRIKEAHPEIEVIMVTGVKQPGEGKLEEAKRLGASYYITKPFITKQLKEIVKGPSAVKPKEVSFELEQSPLSQDLLGIAYNTLRMLNRLKDPLAVVRELVTTAVNRFNFIHASILLYEREENSYVLVESGGEAKIPKDLVRWSSESELIRFFADKTTYPSVDRRFLTITDIEGVLKNEELLKREKGLFDALTEIKEEMKNLRNSQICVPIYTVNNFLGLFLGARSQDRDFSAEEKDFLTILMEDIAVAVEKDQQNQDTAKTLQDLKEAQQELKKSNIQSLRTFAQLIDARDRYTIEHSLRVAEYCLVIAEELGLPQEKIEILKVSAEFHDIGKVGFPDSIIKGEHRLTEEEYKLVKQHPLEGEKMLSLYDFLAPHRKIVRYHHERFDGSGYPEGLKGEGIPLEARIMALADVLDVLFSGRLYQGAFNFKQVVREVIKSTYYQSPQFDPQVVEAFLKATGEGKIRGELLTDKELQQIRKEAAEEVEREKKTISFITEQLGLEGKKVTTRAKFIDDLKVTPQDIIRVMKSIGKEFGIEVSDKDAEGIESIKDVLLCVNEKLEGVK